MNDVPRDTTQTALHDAWFNGVMTCACAGGAGWVWWFDRGRGLRAVLPVPLAFQLGIFAILALLATIDAWRAYRRFLAIEAASLSDLESEVPMPEAPVAIERSWLSRRSRYVILGLLVAALAYQYALVRLQFTGPIVFRNATIASNTGSLVENMTVGVANGKIAFVGEAGEALPALLMHARELDAHGAMVSAATFDRTTTAPLEGLRHVWVGQLYDGAPGDVVITPVPQGRRRGGPPGMPREVLGAVINGRYYPAGELTKNR